MRDFENWPTVIITSSLKQSCWVAQ